MHDSTIVDASRYRSLMMRNWWAVKVDKHVSATTYIDRYGVPANSRVQMHREIMEAKSGQEVDHRNGNSLDNRRSNLRFCTKSQNAMNRPQRKDNSSGRTGVFWRKEQRRWMAIITANKKRVHLGNFLSKQEAVKAREEAEKVYHGEFSSNLYRNHIGQIL